MGISKYRRIKRCCFLDGECQSDLDCSTAEGCSDGLCVTIDFKPETSALKTGNK